jgi:hypothetical protein
MISRFTRSFIFSCIALLLIGSLFFLNPPIRVDFNSDNDEWFNEDGVPHTPASVVKHDSSGGVIMGKLGNETAK